MKKKRNIDSDFILNGKLMSVLMAVSLPLMVNNLIVTLYNLADGLWVARLSSTQFAATSFTWPVQYLFISLALGVSIAGTSLIARYIGAKRKRDAARYANHVIVLLASIGLVFSIVGYLIAPVIIKLMGATGDLRTLSTIYLQMNFFGFFFDSMFFSFQAILNAQGQTKHTTIVTGISSIINIGLDPILIFDKIPFLNIPGFGMGIAGAACATVISKVFSFAIGIYLIKTKSKEVKLDFKDFKFETKIGANIIKSGIPTAVGQSAAAFGFTILNSFIVSFGTATVAAFSMVNRMTDIMMQPIAGISGGITSIIAQNLGANQGIRARNFFFEAVKIVLAISIVSAIAIKIFDIELINLFISEKDGIEVIKEAKNYINYSIINIPLMGLFNIFAGVFQGTGNMKYSMNMSIFRLWIVRLPLVYFFMKFTTLSSSGVWIAMVVSNTLVSIYAYSLYKRIKWDTNN